MQYRYRQPKNEDAFEEFCLVLLRDHWSLPTLERYGHRGEGQDGVDLLDTGGGNPLRAVQCKHHELTKTLPPKELEAEVEKAKHFPEKIGEFYVLTTAKKSVQAQRKVRSINKDHAAKGLFIVQLLTWDDIERIIDTSAAGQEFIGGQGTQVIRKVLRDEIKPVLTMVRDQGDELHSAELDEVKKHLAGKEIQLATLLLGRLRKKSWDQMSPRNRWRWCTLLADAESRQGNDTKAAQLLIEAKAHEPDDDAAVANEIMAYELLGNRGRAFQLAVAGIPSRPHSAAIYAAAVRTAPGPSDFARLFESRPEHLKDDGDVWVAAATRDDLEPSIEKAVATAKRATLLAGENPLAWFALGSVLLRSELRKVDPEDTPTLEAPARARLEEARDAFTKVGDLASHRGALAFQASALIRRATAQALLGDDREAHRDIEEARRLSPNDPAVLMASARVEEERGNHDESVKLLRQIVMREPDDEARFLLGISLWNRNVTGDRTEAVGLLASVGLAGTVHTEAANELAVEGMINQGLHADVAEHLTKVTARVDATFVATSRALSETAQGRSEQASAFASDAVRSISNRTSRRTLRRLARLLVSLGRLADALPVWERLVVRGVVDDDVRSFVDCAGRLERHGRVMEVCANARAAGIFDGFLLRSELRLLDRYNPDAALSLLEETVRRPEVDRGARVHLVHLAIRLGKTALAESHIEQLPSAAEADAEEGAAVVGALGALGRAEEAQAYAYDLLRRHFQDHHAHRAFRDAVMLRDRSGEPDELEVPEVAAPGVAACLSEEGSALLQWFVLEDSSVPATGVEAEIRPDSSLGRRLVGKKVGDVVALSEGPGVTRTATVRELLPKRVFRVRDVMDRWQYRFPDHQEMWMVRLPTTGPEEKPDFSSLIELAKDQHRRQKEAEALYSEKSIPVWLFGRALRKTEVFAVGHIAGTDGLVLRCCAGSADEYADASQSLKAASEVVIDLTAVSTLLLIEDLGVLDALGKTLIVTHSTMSGIRAFVQKARDHTQAGSSMGANEDGPLLYVESPEGKRSALEAVERFQRTIEEKCRVLGCPALADVDPSDRKVLEDGIGPSALESLVLGAAASRIVWTDDAIVAVLGREKFGTKRVWTQAVFRWLNEQGIIANDRYAAVSASLLGMQYMFTSVNPEVMRCAGNRSDWRPERRPLKQALWYLSIDGVRAEDAALLSAMLVAHCYRDAVLPETRRVLLQAVAEGLGKRTDAERTVPLFGSILGRVFGLNVAGQLDAVQTFEAWRREQLRRVSPVRR